MVQEVRPAVEERWKDDEVRKLDRGGCGRVGALILCMNTNFNEEGFFFI